MLLHALFMPLLVILRRQSVASLEPCVDGALHRGRRIVECDRKVTIGCVTVRACWSICMWFCGRKLLLYGVEKFNDWSPNTSSETSPALGNSTFEQSWAEPIVVSAQESRFGLAKSRIGVDIYARNDGTEDDSTFHFGVMLGV